MPVDQRLRLETRSTTVPPPSRHHMALMIWLAVVPTLTVVQLLIGAALRDTPLVLRTIVLATIAVPIVVYVLLPLLLRARARLLTRRRSS